MTRTRNLRSSISIDVRVAKVGNINLLPLASILLWLCGRKNSYYKETRGTNFTNFRNCLAWAWKSNISSSFFLALATFCVEREKYFN